MASSLPTGDFLEFCEFVIRMRDDRSEQLTPEESVKQFRDYQARLKRWNDRNAISADQATRGDAKPLDDETVLRRLHERLARDGIAD